ncbi:MAG: ribosome-associated translation inhibitor RaiA [Clostridia bacterium]|nr:ribosome-associated translation inhibitor RaiA [Clostridia bacterium]MBQ4397380.1 ribosome-associated translation inhibitor RaiA [Clostridia bacterium]
MKLTITGRKINLRDSFKERVEKKFTRFDKFFDENADANVTVNMERNRYTIEVTVRSDGYIYRAEKSGLDLDEALDLVIDSLSAQIRRNKKKLAKRFKNTAGKEIFEPFGGDPEDEAQEDEQFQIVRTKTFPVYAMDVDEAVLQMNMLGHKFFIFRNSESGQINVVYLRRDGDYGLLIPEDK